MIYVLNIRVYVISLIYVQFNKLTTGCSIQDGRPKGNIRLKYLEFGISRSCSYKYNVLTLVGKRKIHSTSDDYKRRKESSYTRFVKSVLSGSEIHKHLLKLNYQLETKGFVNNLSDIMVNFSFLSICWRDIKSRNVKLYSRKELKDYDSQFVKWSLIFIKYFRSGDVYFSYDSDIIKLSKSRQKFDVSFVFSDSIIQYAFQLLLVFSFEKYTIRDLENEFRYKGCLDALLKVKRNFGSSIFFLQGSLPLDKKRLMKIVSYRIKDQPFLDLLYKYIKYDCFDEFTYLKTILNSMTIDRKLLSFLLMEIYYNDFDSWFENVLLPRYQGNWKGLIDCNESYNFYYVRYFSQILIGIKSSRFDSIELMNRIRERFQVIGNSGNKGNLILSSKKINFLGYIVSIDVTLNRIVLIAPIDRINIQFRNAGFLTSSLKPTRNCRYLSLNLVKIVKLFVNLEKVVLSYYTLSSNYEYLLKRVCYLLKYSCALTICSKMQLKSLRKTFKKYGSTLRVQTSNWNYVNYNYYGRNKLIVLKTVVFKNNSYFLNELIVN
jgi:hypothetical protein